MGQEGCGRWGHSGCWHPGGRCRPQVQKIAKVCHSVCTSPAMLHTPGQKPDASFTRSTSLAHLHCACHVPFCCCLKLLEFSDATWPMQPLSGLVRCLVLSVGPAVGPSLKLQILPQPEAAGTHEKTDLLRHQAPVAQIQPSSSCLHEGSIQQLMQGCATTSKQALLRSHHRSCYITSSRCCQTLLFFFFPFYVTSEFQSVVSSLSKGFFSLPCRGLLHRPQQGLCNNSSTLVGLPLRKVSLL